MKDKPTFIKGLELNRGFYNDIVKPLMVQEFPRLKYSVGVVGHGSHVLGFDTEQSTDHNWGPHLQFFFQEEEFDEVKPRVDEMLRHKLPYTYKGFSTNFTRPNEETYLVQEMDYITEGPVNHLCQFFTIQSFFEHYLGYNPYKKISTRDWLIFPQQSLIEVTSGEVFHDGLKKLHFMRKKFAYYPKDVWMYIYLIQWDKIANEEAFMGRAGDVGDELGSSLIAARAVSNIMKLCFLIEKKYIPYSKWFGSAFNRLKSAEQMQPLLLKVVHQKTWHEREETLSQVYELLANQHNSLNITKPIATEVRNYHGRPYKVINAREVYKTIYPKIKNSFFRRLKYKLGSIDQFINHAKINLMEYVYHEFKDVIR